MKNNILFGTDLVRENDSESEMQKFATIANVHNDIIGLQKQYETVVGERGVMLSGGQKQRISIARSLAKNPELVILDDCLSAVDANTEKIILDNLNTTLKNKTVIFITHRIFSIMNFNQILVLDNGIIVEQGNHQELLNKNGVYFDLYQLQNE